MFDIMGGSHTPKQGDHVFNAFGEVLWRPFESLTALNSPPADGARFIQFYLLGCADRIQHLGAVEALTTARRLTVSQGDEEDALRALAGFSDRRPVLRRVNPAMLRKIHLENARDFGEAARYYELEVLRAVQSAIEGLVVASTQGAAQVDSDTKAGIAFQRVLNHAYDPGSALVIIAKSVQNENPAAQGAFLGLIESIADKLERPAMWRDPFDAFPESNALRSETGRIVRTISEGLRQLFYSKVPGLSLDVALRQEIKQSARGMALQGSEASALLFGLQNRIQKLRAGADS
jgi:hypothetical protein